MHIHSGKSMFSQYQTTLNKTHGGKAISIFLIKCNTNAIKLR